MSKPPRKRMLGLGLNGNDGHKRITQSENFTVAGGSQETHERITETLIKTEEALKRKGRDFNTADPREIRDRLIENQQ